MGIWIAIRGIAKLPGHRAPLAGEADVVERAQGYDDLDDRRDGHGVPLWEPSGPDLPKCYGSRLVPLRAPALNSGGTIARKPGGLLVHHRPAHAQLRPSDSHYFHNFPLSG